LPGIGGLSGEGDRQLPCRGTHGAADRSAGARCVYSPGPAKVDPNGEFEVELMMDRYSDQIASMINDWLTKQGLAE
jgi:hypothetical protein